MKTQLPILLTAIFCMIFSSIQSQVVKGQPRLRDRIVMAKFNEIRKSLELDQGTAQRLRPVYFRYENEIAGVSKRELGQLMRADPDSLTTMEAETIITTQLENAKKVIAIREKYYRLFKTVLTPQQIVKLYQTEAGMRRKMMQEVRKRFGN